MKIEYASGEHINLYYFTTDRWRVKVLARGGRATKHSMRSCKRCHGLHWARTRAFTEIRDAPCCHRRSAGHGRRMWRARLCAGDTTVARCKPLYRPASVAPRQAPVRVETSPPGGGIAATQRRLWKLRTLPTLTMRRPRSSCVARHRRTMDHGHAKTTTPRLELRLLPSWECT